MSIATGHIAILSHLQLTAQSYTEYSWISHVQLLVLHMQPIPKLSIVCVTGGERWIKSQAWTHPIKADVQDLSTVPDQCPLKSKFPIRSLCPLSGRDERWAPGWLGRQTTKSQIQTTAWEQIQSSYRWMLRSLATALRMNTLTMSACISILFFCIQ